MLDTGLAVSDGILDKRLILVGGKGGVGRSAMSSAIALACARRGRRTLLFEANANDRFGAWFDRPPVGTSLSVTLFKPGTPSIIYFEMPLFEDDFEAGSTIRWSSEGTD